MPCYSTILRYLPFWLPAMVVGFIVFDLCWERPVVPHLRSAGDLPFSHALHVDSLLMDCTYCHSGVWNGAQAGMPSRATCLDCHRVPVSTSPTLPAFDSALAAAPEFPWAQRTQLPDHVRFYHSVHRLNAISCLDCHGDSREIDRGRQALVDMRSCVECHEKNRADTDCSTCHR